MLHYFRKHVIYVANCYDKEVCASLLLQGLSVPYLWVLMDRKRVLRIPFPVDKDTKVCLTHV